jgi:hypothetical protein
MENKNHVRKQVDLFAQDGDRMQWQQLPENDRRQTQQLFAQLLVKLVANDLTCVHLKENIHAAEDNV